MRRVALVLGLTAVLWAGATPPARADCGCPGNARPTGATNRSRGTHATTGVGVGLAGIGLAWGAMRVGLRAAGWASRRRPK